MSDSLVNDRTVTDSSKGDEAVRGHRSVSGS